ncbi:DUF2339 domain-containing protein [Bacillus sp. BGMRC 2118]|nr:DUF2339 domain-containing protein [Bacillus sp. BGMRC 2118]
MSEKIRIEQLESRVNALSREAIELKLLIEQLKSESTVETTDSPKQIAQPLKIHTHVPKQTKKAVDWEKQIGQVWLPRIFIFVLLLGVIWAFKAASDYGLLNNFVKIALGYSAAGLLVWLGNKQIKEKRIALGQVLLGGSVVLLLIVTFAMHVLFAMVPMLVALFINIIWIGLGVYFSHRHESEPLAVVTGVGGYLIPFLLESTNPTIFGFIAFETILYITLLLFAMKKQYMILYHVSFALLHVTLLAGSFIIRHDNLEAFNVAIFIQHVVLLVAFCLNRLNKLQQQMGTLFASFLLTLLWVESTLSTLQYELILMSILIGYVALSVYFWKKSVIRLSLTLPIATLSMLFLIASRFDLDDIVGIILIQAVFSIYIGVKASSRIQQLLGAFIYIVAALLTISDRFYYIFSLDFLNWLLLLLTLIMVRQLIVKTVERKELKQQLIQSVNILFAVLLLAFISLTVSVITENLWLSLNFQYMSISLVWSLYAISCIVVGSKRNNKVLRIFGMSLLFVTLGKLLLVDLAYVSIFIRAVLFIILGLCGIVVSRIFYKDRREES